MTWIDGGYPAREQADHRPSSDRDGVVPEGRSPAAGGATRWIIPVGVAAGYALLTLAVHLRLLDALDLAIRDVYRPGNVWGPLQIRADRFIKWLQPEHLAVPLLLLVAGLSLLRRSLRPVVVLAAVGVPVAIATLGTKWIMAHSEGNPLPVGHGSFPSGHTVSVIFAFGLALLLLRPDTRWGWIIPAAMGCLMGWALVVVVMHPATDVIGACLLAAAVLASARAIGLGQWASDRQRRVGGRVRR
ncbi:MAG: phosphatase PAP2 family protein [Actinomycetes bacterium]